MKVNVLYIFVIAMLICADSGRISVNGIVLYRR